MFVLHSQIADECSIRPRGAYLNRWPNSQMRSSRLWRGGAGARPGSMWKLSPWQEMGPLEMPWQAFRAALTAGLSSSSTCRSAQ